MTDMTYRDTMTQLELITYSRNAFKMALKCINPDDHKALLDVAWLFHHAAMQIKNDE